MASLPLAVERAMPAINQIIAVAACLALPAFAQSAGEPRMPMKPDFAAALGIPAETAAQVEAVMQREREEMRRIHQATRAELAKILTPEQLARLDELMPRRPPGHPPPQRR
jgi:hypothetical protein